MTPIERKALKARAHALDPVVFVGGTRASGTARAPAPRSRQPETTQPPSTGKSTPLM
jgi:hypothetical protein